MKGLKRAFKLGQNKVETEVTLTIARRPVDEDYQSGAEIASTNWPIFGGSLKRLVQGDPAVRRRHGPEKEIELYLT